MNTLHRIGPLLGRLLIAQIFLMSGISKITGFEGTVGYIASMCLPLPHLLAGGSLLVEFVGGLLLFFGWNTRWAAASLFVFTLLAALFFFFFWFLFVVLVLFLL